MGRKSTFFNRLASSMAIVVVLALSLGLLTYVGFGEARRTYPKFEIEKLAAQGEVVKKTVDTFLLANLPLEQFPGFSTLSDPILDSDKSIAAVYLTGVRGQTIFSNFPDDVAIRSLDTVKFKPSSLQENDDTYRVSESASYYRVTLALRSKLEQVGDLHLLVPRAVINQKINDFFIWVVLVATGLLVAYAIFVFVGTRRWGTSGEGTRWLSISYGITFFLMAVVVVTTLVLLYSDGIEGKTKALGNSLAQRLNSPLELGLQINDFDHLDQTFKDYQKLNPDLSSVILIVDNKVAIDTNLTRIGSTWTSDNSQIEYRAQLLGTTGVPAGAVVVVGIPKSVVVEKLWRSVKNFIVLFIASILLSTLFFNLIRAFSRYRGSERGLENQRAFQLSLVGPLYFMAIFADSLTNSFLPQHFQELAQKSGADTGLVPTLFTVYFICYALALIPAGRFAEGSIKPLFLIGTLLLVSQLLILTFFDNFYVMYLVEAMAGFGTGIIFIGVQAYILQVAASTQRTRAAAIIVFGYNGGVISAMAIGALLAADPALGRQGVFLIGGVIAFLVFVYAFFLMPKKLGFTSPVVPTNVSAEAESALQSSVVVRTGFRQGFVRAMKDLRFVKAIVLIAIPTKIVLTGLIIASLPLMLSRQNYQTEDISQIIMFYSAGVLISSRFMSRLADRTGKTTGLLFWGTIGSGVGLILIGIIGWSGFSLPILSTLTLIAGLAALGVAHGCISAPLLTFVSDTPTAQRLGKTSATSLYRLLERAGNIAGPLVVGQLLILNGYSSSAIGWLGIVLLFFGVLFVIGTRRTAKSPKSLGMSTPQS